MSSAGRFNACPLFYLIVDSVQQSNRPYQALAIEQMVV
jgi:hypothetical protein